MRKTLCPHKRLGGIFLVFVQQLLITGYFSFGEVILLLGHALDAFTFEVISSFRRGLA